jgi:hypothetical protein
MKAMAPMAQIAKTKVFFIVLFDFLFVDFVCDFFCLLLDLSVSGDPKERPMPNLSHG